MADIALNPVTIMVNGDFAKASNPLPVSVSEAVGALTWTKTAVTMSGASATLLALNASRKAFIVSSTATNSSAAIDITGGTAVLSAGIPLAGGASLSMSGADCPTTAITQIGTNAQVLTVYEGV